MVITMFVYQFTHSVILCKQRQHEHALLPDTIENKRGHMCYYLDVIYAMTLPILSVLFYFAHFFAGSYGQLIFGGGHQHDRESFDGEYDEPFNPDYKWEWVSFSLMSLYFMIYSYIFLEDNVVNELKEYSIWTKWNCCFI